MVKHKIIAKLSGCSEGICFKKAANSSVIFVCINSCTHFVFKGLMCQQQYLFILTAELYLFVWNYETTNKFLIFNWCLWEKQQHESVCLIWLCLDGTVTAEQEEIMMFTWSTKLWPAETKILCTGRVHFLCVLTSQRNVHELSMAEGSFAASSCFMLGYDGKVILLGFEEMCTTFFAEFRSRSDFALSQLVFLCQINSLLCYGGIAHCNQPQ